MIILIEEPMNHTGKDVLIERVPGVLVLIQNLDDVPNLHFFAVHLFVMFFHLAVGNWRQSVPILPVSVNDVVVAFAIIDQPWVGDDTVPLNHSQFRNRSARQKVLENS